MSYDIFATEDVIEFLDDLDCDSCNHCHNNIEKLEDNPFPGKGRGDKKKLTNSDYYRLHIGREYTAIYLIDKDNRKVEIEDLMTIDKAHKRYGRYVR